jgi:NTE family protein
MPRSTDKPSPADIPSPADVSSPTDAPSPTEKPSPADVPSPTDVRRSTDKPRSTDVARPTRPVAFVLGGGGVHGAAEVGMLRALLEVGITPDMVLGTSVGAINGSALARDPDLKGVQRLTSLWEGLAGDDIFGGSLVARTATLVKTRTHLHPHGPMRRLLRDEFDQIRIEDLPVAFECVAASIERAREHWFTDGPVVDAVLASCAVPGLLPAVRIDDEHFLDGGLVDSIPVGRALQRGARTVYVLQVGRVEGPLRAPRQPWEVAMISFEIARRHRFATTMASLPADVDVHLLPSGDVLAFNDRRQLRYRDFSRVPGRIDAAYVASLDYLRGVGVRQ